MACWVKGVEVMSTTSTVWFLYLLPAEMTGSAFDFMFSFAGWWDKIHKFHQTNWWPSYQLQVNQISWIFVTSYPSTYQHVHIRIQNLPQKNCQLVEPKTIKTTSLKSPSVGNLRSPLKEKPYESYSSYSANTTFPYISHEKQKLIALDQQAMNNFSKDHIFLWISSKSQGGHCIKKTFPRNLGKLRTTRQSTRWGNGFF